LLLNKRIILRGQFLQLQKDIAALSGWPLSHYVLLSGYVANFLTISSMRFDLNQAKALPSTP
jgi:hypothetical protein